jgi:diguanylate cyclase
MRAPLPWMVACARTLGSGHMVLARDLPSSPLFPAVRWPLALRALARSGVTGLLLVLVNLMGASVNAATSPVIVVHDDIAQWDLWPQVRRVQAQGNTVEPEVILSLAERLPPSAAPRNNLGPTDGPVWLHLPVQIDAQSNGQWILHIDHAALSSAEVFVLDESRQRLAQHHLGTDRAFGDRPLPTLAHAVALSLPPGARVDILLRATATGALVVPISLKKPAALIAEESRAHLAQGLFLGMTWVLMLASAAFAFTAKDRIYAAYALMLAGAVVYFLDGSGLGQQYLWDGPLEGMTGKLGAMAALVMVAAHAALARDAMALKSMAPAIDGGLKALSIMALAGLAVSPLSGLTNMHMLQLAAIAMPLAAGLALLASWPRMRTGDASGASLFLGSSVLLVGTVAAAALGQGHLPANPWTLNALQVSVCVQILTWIHVLVLRARNLSRSADTHSERLALGWSDMSDALTGLANRRGMARVLAQTLDDRVNGETAAAKIVGVYMLDLDGFKAINDAYGHAIGDALLVQVARRLQALMRAGDTVARLGGDEFCVLIRDIEDDTDAHALGQKMLSAFRESFEVDRLPCTVATTIGYAVAPEHGIDGVELMRCADFALIQGKRAGRHQLMRYAGPESEAPGALPQKPAFVLQTHRFETDSELRRGLETSQPQPR